jgi:uncharacterized protein YndB with AHSA1/START domain
MSAEPTFPTARVERVLPARPHEAFDAWIDEAALARFICPPPGRAAAVSINPTMGGALRLVMTYAGERFEIAGRYVAVDRPHRLSFTWRSPEAGELESIVTVVFAPRGDGRTLMTIFHSRQPADRVERRQAGWASVAEQLERLLAGPDSG